jgi:hypothetical protein
MSSKDHHTFHSGDEVMQVAAALDAFYSKSSDPVIITANEPADIEWVPVGLWGQIPLSLKKEYSFCSYALTPRSLGGKLLDMQIVPSTSGRSLRSQAHNAVTVEWHQSSNLHPSRWLDALVRDLSTCDWILREFIESFAAGVSASREVVPQLAHIYCIAEGVVDVDDLKELYTQIAQYWPQKSEALDLKRAFIQLSADPRSTAVQHARAFSGSERLVALLQVRGNAFDAAAHVLRDLALQSTEESMNSIAHAVGKHVTDYDSVVAQIALEALSRHISDELLIDMLKGKPNLAVKLASVEPQILYRPAVWESSPDVSAELLQQANTHLITGDLELKQLVVATLQARYEGNLSQLALTPIEQFVGVVLSGIDELSPELSRTTPWKQLLRKSNAGALLYWLDSRQDAKKGTVRLVLDCVDPTSASLEHHFNAIQSMIALDETDLDGLVQKAATMAFICGLVATNQPAYNLIEWSFPRLHRILENSGMRHEHWNMLQNYLRDYPAWKPWDQCGRLRIATVKAFSRNNWPMQSFLRTFSNTYLLDRVVRDSNAYYLELAYIRKVAHAVYAGELTATPDQRDYLEWYVY